MSRPSRLRRRGVRGTRCRLRPGLEVVESRQLLATIVVTSSGDTPQPGVTTLREAITQANAQTGLDTIAFKLDTPSPISVLTQLPAITDPVIIDGRTQGGFTGTPLIVIDGSLAPSGTSGLVESAGGTQILALGIANFSGSGLVIDGPGGDTIAGNYIGFQTVGSPPPNPGNLGGGIVINGSPGNTIGGLTTADRNVIGNNTLYGIHIQGNLATGNVVVGNYLGVGPDGTTAAPNTAGIVLDSADDTTIGGSVAGARNIISGNGGDGVTLGTGTDRTLVQGNYIGTDALGQVDVANAGDGVRLTGASNNTIGGSNAATPNVITGNQGSGISINGVGSTGNLVVNNLIGQNLAGSSAGNILDGVQINDASNNTVGGSIPSGGNPLNVIQNNGGNGVAIAGLGQPANANVVAGNLIGDTSSTPTNGNRGAGIIVTIGAANTDIGGDDASFGNVIAGNAQSGIVLSDSSVTGTRIRANYVGGFTTTGNTGDGIQIFSSTGTTIGGTTAGERNIISANTGAGIFTDDASGTVIIGNIIGLADDGNTPRGNVGTGIFLSGGANNTVGGTAANAGNVISSNGDDGVTLGSGATGTLIQGNRIGTNAAGSDDRGNAGRGVAILGSPNNTVGGGTLAARNVITGNAGDGVFISVAGAIGNLVAGNLIGLGLSGASAGNTGSGVSVVGVGSNTIGGLTTGAGLAPGNVITNNGRTPQAPGIIIKGDASDPANSNVVQGNAIGLSADGLTPIGNGGAGIEIDGVTANTLIGSDSSVAFGGNRIVSNLRGIVLNGGQVTGTQILGNLIGAAAAGETGFGNAQGGVVIISAESTVVGGVLPSAGNVISGNGVQGVLLSSNASGNVLLGNKIGVSADGTTPLGNNGVGVRIEDGSNTNTVGGFSPSAGNIIAGNAAAGVALPNSDTNNPVANAIVGNSIYANGGLGIDLGPTGVTPNDDKDPDPGPNLLQNFPVITDAVYFDGKLRVRGFLNSIPNQTYLLQFFADAGDPSGNGEGQYLIGSGDTQITTDPDTGTASFDVTFNTPLPLAMNLTATASRRLGSFAFETGEFSAFVPIEVASFVVTNTNDAGRGSLRQAILFANAVPGPQTITFAIPTTGPCSVIRPLTPLPDIFDSALVDARTQPGYAGTPVVELDGSALNPLQPGSGLSILADASGVFGLAIHSFPLMGISVVDAGSIVIQANYIGLDCSGQAAPGNRGGGIRFIVSSNNLIGGQTDAERNVISGNGELGGIVLAGFSQGSKISNNRIGTSADGRVALGNSVGIRIIAASRNFIGPATGLGSDSNLISGNTIGVLLTNGASENLILGNLIGTGPDGDGAVPNTEDGVALEDSPGNTVGAAGVLRANVIAGNGLSGVRVTGTGSKGNLIAGNFIGLGLSGTRVISNGSDGVFIDGAPGNVVGGSTANLNVIAGNNSVNVQVYGRTAEGNLISNNLIGLDLAGNIALPARGRTQVGVFVNDAPSTTVSENVVGGNEVGIELYNPGAAGNVVQGNRVGTDVTGTARRPNGTGVFVFNAPGNLLSGNLSSGNEDFGVRLTGSAASGNRVQANAIGTDVTGRTALGNDQDGLFIQAPGTAVVQNVVSGNGSVGIQLFGPQATGNVLLNNAVGTDITGSTPLGNRRDGVYLNEAPGNTLIGNVVSANGSVGVQVFGDSSAGNVLQGNRIGTNAGGSVVAGFGNLYGVFINTLAPFTLASDNIIRGNQQANIVRSPELLPPGVTEVRLVTRESQITAVVVSYSSPMDVASVQNVNNYRLLRVARPRSPLGQPIPVASATYDPASRSVTLVPGASMLTNQTFRLTVVGRPPSGVRDTHGRFLSGNATGRSGSDFVIVLGAGTSSRPIRARRASGR